MFRDENEWGCSGWVGENCHDYPGYDAAALGNIRRACPQACNLCSRLNVIFIHVAKSGGMSVGQALEKVGLEFQIHMEEAVQACMGRGAPGPISAAMNLVPALSDHRLFTATVLWVRDPVTRLLSVWNFLCKV